MPAASQATTVDPKAKPAPERSASAAATRKQPANTAVAPAPASRETAKAPAGTRSAAIAGAATPLAPIADEPSLAPGPIAPEPFSIVEFKQRLAAEVAAEATGSEPPCDDRFGLFSHKRCALQALEPSNTRPWP